MPLFADPSLRTAIEQVAVSLDGGPAHHVAPEHRRAVLRDVFFESDPNWFPAFAVMLAAASLMAGIGLYEDSAAALIGAMVIAPLGSPIVALGGALALGWHRETGRLLLVVALGATCVVLLGLGLGLVLPDAVPGEQLLARATPDLRDLAVGLLGGIASAYARTRDDLSSSLTGVAIAVALVPALVAAGMFLELGLLQLALNALLLFAVSIVGIALAAALVLLFTGYAPWPRPGAAGIALGLGLALALALLGPRLPGAFRQAVSAGEEIAAVHRVVATVGGPQVRHIAVDPAEVTVEVSDPQQAYDPDELEQRLAQALGSTRSVVVQRR